LSAWRRNAWLGIFGAALVALAALGSDGLVAVASHLYRRLPMLAPVFRADHESQVRALHPILAALGVASLLGYLAASRRAVALWPRLLSLRGNPRERLRTSAAAAVVLYSVLLVPVRIARDALRERALDGLSDEDRRLRLYGVHSREPDYAAIEAFRRASGGRGDLLVARSGPSASFDDVFLASYLFPQRVFVRTGSDCSPEELPRLRAERSAAAWVEWACVDSDFSPMPLRPR
jgi:hypothetical protein